jgi:hypothetical protein
VNNSNDPIQANFKKNDQYWKCVADVFNSTTPKDRVRTAKQIKDHFGTQQQQQQHSLLSQASWGRLEMKPKRDDKQGDT